MKAEKYVLENVTLSPDLWESGDPVRPELGVRFKTAEGRAVYGLKTEANEYVAFCCVSRTTQVPTDIIELSEFTSVLGTILVPYTVWSLQRGAGKAIIKQILDKVNEKGMAHRVVTLSPLTDMARRFHLRNGATEVARGVVTANFEYPISVGKELDDWCQSATENDWDCTPQGEPL